MRNGIAGIDHVIIGVRDLERARMGWTRLGFTLSPRGRHLGQATANYCIMFPRDYLELLGVVGEDAHSHRLGAFLAHREGVVGPAFAPAGSPEATRGALAALGLHPSEPRALGRQLELPEGTVVPRFSLINLPPEETPALDCFICAHLTPELMRRPEWLDHPNGAVGVKGVHVLVNDIDAVRPPFERLAGADAITHEGDALTVALGRHRLRFSTTAAFQTRYPGDDLVPDFPLPGVAALELLVADRERTADHLTQWQIPFDELADGTIAVPAREANGVLLLLSEG
jgi:catechol 2,3-dioxygenase-like lactoylglutathione lyase family enzyme